MTTNAFSSFPFVERHIGPRDRDIKSMLGVVGATSLDALVADAVPRDIRVEQPLQLGEPLSETEALDALRSRANANDSRKSFIGTGYYGTITPAVIRRNIFENPGWYTAYTPYQAEIAQGRLEALINFQTMVGDLTGLPLANSSLLDEATAAAEALNMCRAKSRGKRNRVFVSDRCHPQTIEVIRTRTEPVGALLEVGPLAELRLGADLAGVLVQYPDTFGGIEDPRALVDRVHGCGAFLVCATDLLALTMLAPPGEIGADIAVGSTQRFGVPMGYGGPHAAFLACTNAFKRQLPGRLVGVSKDGSGRVAYRLALQTREQHIRRDRATSNICTAQVLLAIIASMYAVYHGPHGLTRIARGVHRRACALAARLVELGYALECDTFFDTIHIAVAGEHRDALASALDDARLNVRWTELGTAISVDETTSGEDIDVLCRAYAGHAVTGDSAAAAATARDIRVPTELLRQSEFLTHSVFHRHHSEHEMLRYLHRLEAKDLALNTSMIPLGSCTMKLNAAAEMEPISWEGFANMHPFAPAEQAAGYRKMMTELERWLAEITGFAAVSLQPNAGAQGEYAGLLAIRAYHRARGQEERNVCLIPTSAHGTNPASAVLAGFDVVAVRCDPHGNIDVEDLIAKAEEHSGRLGALMITYPSTHGVFEERIRDICAAVHANGGQVYLDGANMNAQVGLCRPGDYGADVCHLNLHKTFCIPHGGGGPGMGPIGVAGHLSEFLPGHPNTDDHTSAVGPVSAAPFGSPSILPISWAYIAMMGTAGLTRASEIAILSANYMAEKLRGAYEVLYTAKSGRVAHEFILDIRPIKKACGVEVDDIAKRLMDFGFHAPTMSFPVAGTLMIEPTESESKEELDRFIETMLIIREEIRAVDEGHMALEDSPLRRAPHTASDVIGEWNRAYSREQAAYPVPWLREHKYWPPVSRIDNAFGDRNLVCTCVSVDDVAS